MKPKRRILVVDDQQDIRDLAVAVLASGGYDTLSVSSGDEALELLARDPVDLVLLDINMPGMDGWETLRLIRSDDELIYLPVVMFSVKGELVDKVQGMQEGATDYITKPFEVDTLISRVRRVFESAEREPRPPLPSSVI